MRIPNPTRQNFRDLSYSNLSLPHPHPQGDTVVAMTMNAGMTDMIMNFVCSARRAGKSLKHVVLFPTDDEVELVKISQYI